MKHRYSRLVVAGLVALTVAACGSDSSDYGKAGDPAQASRTVDVAITPAKTYDPCSIGVKPGETVAFKVTNNAAELHELVIGDEKVQAEHGKMMGGMSMENMKVADRPNLVNLDPGQTKSLTWTFPTEAGAVVIYGSHVPGDYTGGLRGTMTVGEAAACQTAAGGAATTVAGGTATTMGDMGGATTTTPGGTATTAANAGGGGTATTMPGMDSTTGLGGGGEGGRGRGDGTTGGAGGAEGY